MISCEWNKIIKKKKKKKKERGYFIESTRYKQLSAYLNPSIVLGHDILDTILS